MPSPGTCCTAVHAVPNKSSKQSSLRTGSKSSLCGTMIWRRTNDAWSCGSEQRLAAGHCAIRQEKHDRDGWVTSGQRWTRVVILYAQGRNDLDHDGCYVKRDWASRKSDRQCEIYSRRQLRCLEATSVKSWGSGPCWLRLATGFVEQSCWIGSRCQVVQTCGS